MFKSPVICAPMNGVSDLNLGLACARAGVVPSLIPYSFPNMSEFATAVTEILKECTEIQVAFSFKDIIARADLIKQLGITHIEILDFEQYDLTPENRAAVNQLRSQGVKILLKVLLPNIIDEFIDIIDAVTVKGSEGAGRSAKDIKLETIIFEIKRSYPGLPIVASGGVKNGRDIRLLMSHGACAVSIGTLFAMSKESPIPDSVKDKLLQSTSGDIRRLKMGARQRAIIFDEYGGDDFNNTAGLYSGLRTGKTGHIFVGNALDSITDIVSVQEIVDHLLS